MGYTLPAGLTEAVTRFDPSVEILWNNRIHRWVVAQFGHGMFPVGSSLLGCPRITGERSHYTPIFTCELETSETHKPGDGVPVEPGPWIIEKLAGLRHTKHRTPAEYDAAVKAEEEAKDREKNRQLDSVLDDHRKRMMTFGGKGDDMLTKRHVEISGSPLGA